uniref:Translin-associated factor X-interacting protein 1 N-terminal domain-containing protein n=1 Tax=Oryzias latipes TaxID=8090 RepID=A0A3P9H5L4_ORYLA
MEKLSDDKLFLASLYEFIDREKQYLGCPAEGPDELRYLVYRTVFCKVIDKASACRRVLLIIKAEYDNTIQELKRREGEARAARRRVAAAATHAHSLTVCETRAAQLRDRWVKPQSTLLLWVAVCLNVFLLHRFLQLFDSGQYKDAALHAARSPGGILRNLDVMEMFAGDAAPPPILFFQTLLVTAAAGHRMSSPLSLQGVRCALQHGRLQLVVHAVTQNKVSFTEELGDLLSGHAQKDQGKVDLCLALATLIYEACGLTRKTAASMRRRGLVHNAAELMQQSPDPTAWPCRLLYAFPPLELIAPTLTRVRMGKHSLILVAPRWPGKHWLADIIQMLHSQPWPLPLRRDLLSQARGEIFHPHPERLALWAWPVRG